MKTGQYHPGGSGPELAMSVSSAHDVEMSDATTTVEHGGIVWDSTCVHGTDRGVDAGRALQERSKASLDAPTGVLEMLVQRVASWGVALSRPTFRQLHGDSPMGTVRFAATSSTDAAAKLAEVRSIELDLERGSGRLTLEPLRAAPTQAGRPWTADAVLHGRGRRPLPVSVAIFAYGSRRCGIEIRPRCRRPWSQWRLRRCLDSTHAAADRLRNLVLAADFTPPPTHVESSSEWQPTERG